MKWNGIMAIVALIILASCKAEPYDTGEGTYSQMVADYVDVEVKNHEVRSIVTDNGEALNIQRGMMLDVTPPDTTLRWLLYYNKGSQPDGNVQLLANTPMRLLHPVDASKEDGKEDEEVVIKTDPLKLISAWVSPNGKYFNLRIGLMAGNATEKDTKQVIGLVRNAYHNIKKGKVEYTFYHDQAGVPQYYTQEHYLSLPYPEQDTIVMTINTYKGEYKKTFIKE